MTGIDQLDSIELRAELDEARDRALKALEDLCEAIDACDVVAAATVVLVAKAWLHRERLLRRALRLEAAA